MKTTLLMVGALVLAIPVLIYAIGASLPVEHVAEHQRVVNLPVERVALLIRDVGTHPNWRPDVKKIDILEPAPDLRYRETSKHGEIVFRFRETERNARFESTIDDPKLPFGGRWTITLLSNGNSTQVSIREDGEVYSSLFRFFSRFVFGHDTNILAYLAALEKYAAIGGR